MNLTQAKPLRTRLENAVKAARDVAEKAASADQKALRRRLRAHGQALGDIKHKDQTLPGQLRLESLPHILYIPAQKEPEPC